MKERNKYLEMVLDITESPKSEKALSHKKRVTLAVTSLVLGIVIFTVAYIGMKQQIGLGKFNQPILSWMVDHRNVFVTDIAKNITSIASPIVFAFIVGILVIIWIALKREVWRPALLLASVGTAGLTSFLLKFIIMDSRPAQTNMIPMFETDFSFPSGHTIGVAVFLLVLGYLIYSRHYSAMRFWIWFVVAIIGMGVIALSRLYLGYHWLTDVVASVGLGLIILAIAIVVDMIFIKRLKT